MPRTTLAPALLRLARTRGIDVETLALRAGVEPGLVDDDDADLAPRVVTELLSAAASILGDPCLGLSLPEALSFRRYHFGELCARASGTVGEGLTQLARHASVWHPGAHARVTTDDASFVFRIAVASTPRGDAFVVDEYLLAVAMYFARNAGAATITARRVWFAHPRPRDLAPLVRHFGTRDLAFGEVDNGFELARLDVDRPSVTRDDRLLATVMPLAESEIASQRLEPRLSDVVRSAIAKTLPVADVDSISRALHMSVRTLQRRLDDEGLRFSALLDRERESLACVLLRDPSKTLAEVAERVGFSDLASFGRAFKRWTGSTPAAWRRLPP